uniref:GTP binding protein overexpressed in skeletal muscle n=1 Tax=Cyclopterus lumpus TaxID=8103 RepID=A0A8C2WVT6_CYCLU
MMSSVRRHSLRLQTELHRWSICDPGSHLLQARVHACISRSKSLHQLRRGSRTGAAGAGRPQTRSSPPTLPGSPRKPGRPYRVLLLGASGVGKTAFASIFAGAADSMDSDDCELRGGPTAHVVHVNPSLNCFVFADWPRVCSGALHAGTGDAYLLLYSVTDRASFLRASQLRITLRRFRPAQHTPIILVGNKCDLVRRREVSVSEGRDCAAVFDCKFIETSAAMQHNVWEAFHGMVRQLRLRRDSKAANRRRRHPHCHTRRREPSYEGQTLPRQGDGQEQSSVAFWLKSKSLS